MDRELYLTYRNTGATNPFYEYYKENHKGGILLTMGDFFQAMQMWPHAGEAYGNVLMEYDVKFEIMSIKNKLGQIIKYL